MQDARGARRSLENIGGETTVLHDTDLWEAAKRKLERILDEHSFKNWFGQTSFGSYADGRLVVKVPTQFFADWLRGHYLDVIASSMRELVPDFKDVEFVPSGNMELETSRYARAASDSQAKANRSNGRRNGFNDRYTFDRFVVGASNRFAHAAARAVAQRPGVTYNPLFLYGGTGLGKTHLMQAIGHEVLEGDSGANVVFISAEQFTNQLIDSIQRKFPQRFRAKYRQVDVLLIDDIHFLAGKEATQEEFFHTFNELFDSHKQIVVSCDRGPKEIRGMEERLISRFEWGLVIDIQPPDIETRVAILRNKALEEQITVEERVLRHIANCVTNNIRELEGTFTTALAFCRMNRRPMSMELIDEVLHALIGTEKIRPITVEGIIRVTAEHFDLRIADLKGRSRERQVAYPRQLAMYLAKHLVSTSSLKEIGEAFGGKDHTTVLHAVRKIEQLKTRDESTRQQLVLLEKLVRS